MFGEFNDDKIHELIHCEKLIDELLPKQGYKEINKWYDSRKILLSSLNKPYKFEVFIRKHKTLIENFSIGLIYKALSEDEKNITLCRYNGSHGQNDWSIDKHYSSFHIHKINNDLLKRGITEPKQIEITNKYASFDSALDVFCKDIKIPSIAKVNVVNNSDQLKLFEE